MNVGVKVRYGSNLSTVGTILLDRDLTQAGIPYGNEEIHIRRVSDFPTPVNGVITLADNTTYYIRGSVNLGGLRLVGGIDTCILGSSSENSFLISDLTVDQALITTAYSLPMRHISLNAGSGWCFILDGDGVANAHDWFGVNFLGGKVGRIGTVSNFVVQSLAVLNATEGFEFFGTVGTVSFRDLLSAGGGSYAIRVTEDAVITRRFRLQASSIVVNGSAEGINFSPNASVPIESYILDLVNFGGSAPVANRVVGRQAIDNESLFFNCTGIQNSAKVGALTMQDNAVATTVSQTLTYYKVAGTTVAVPSNQKFSHSNNRLTYTGAIKQTFELSGRISVSSGNNHVVGVVVFVDGVEQAQFEAKGTCNSAGRVENINFFWIGDLEQNQYVEVFVENYTAATNITAESLFYKIRPLVG